MLVKSKMILPGHLFLLLMNIVIAQANNLQRNNDGYSGTELGPAGGAEQEYLRVDLGEHGNDESGTLYSRGEDDIQVIRPRRKKSASQRQWLAQCPKEGSPKRGGVTGYAYMTFHKPGAGRAYRISETRSGNWSTLDIDSMIKDGGFDLKIPTVLYTHGWLQTSGDSWLTYVRKLYNKMDARGAFEPGFNLLTFDWAAYNYAIYGLSVRHVPHLGQLLANFFEQLRDRHNYDTTSIHLVSFSMSTHIVAVAARQLAREDKISQITALDPTGVCFHEEESREFDAEYGLKASDARLVVARHYDMGTFGAKRLIGGLDIIVNDGKTQPFMILASSSNRGVVSHLRATMHEGDPFNLESDCHEMAYACGSYDAFINGQCGDCGSKNESCYLVSTFGNIQLKTPTSIYKPGTQMYTVSGFDRFCAYIYQIVVQLTPNAPPSVIREFSGGRFTFELRADVASVVPNHHDASSSRFTQLLKLSKKIEWLPEQIKVRSKSADLLSSVEYIDIKFLNHVSAEVRQASSIKYCPDKKADAGLISCGQDSRERLSKKRSSKGKSKPK